ncbi:hypothetical protein AYI70_g5845 [Smittium culicis]|uniref:Uncharacterized protein n=1 Tax=Smittium culicis TaxID=133412 RepID=A0A1R1XP79_9FUNG|nr:hypothetical protein AYI70_g6594 [Smittium culicis]OMJ17643.1 hypothetical protein AYI70_g5845 [Smittium culicis]
MKSSCNHSNYCSAQVHRCIRANSNPTYLSFKLRKNTLIYKTCRTMKFTYLTHPVPNPFPPPTPLLQYHATFQYITKVSHYSIAQSSDNYLLT